MKLSEAVETAEALVDFYYEGGDTGLAWKKDVEMLEFFIALGKDLQKGVLITREYQHSANRKTKG